MTKSQMEEWAVRLLDARQREILSADEYKDYHRKFFAHDEEGSIWTVGVSSVQWNKKVGTTWEPNPPPQDLLMSSETIAKFQSLPEEKKEVAENEVPKAPPRKTSTKNKTAPKKATSATTPATGTTPGKKSADTRSGKQDDTGSCLGCSGIIIGGAIIAYFTQVSHKSGAGLGFGIVVLVLSLVLFLSSPSSGDKK